MFVQNQNEKEEAIRNKNDSIQEIDTIEEDMLHVQTLQAPRKSISYNKSKIPSPWRSMLIDNVSLLC